MAAEQHPEAEVSSRIPRHEGGDSTLAFIFEGYTFVSSRCKRYRSDIFEARLMLRKAFCVTGEDAARMFYHPGRFTRQGAMPITTLMLLQDKGSVATLDGEAHRHRKEMFMSLMTPDNIERLAEVMTEEWRGRLVEWQRRSKVMLHPEVQGVLCRAVCRWAGIDLSEHDAEQRTRELAAMIDGAGTMGPRNWKGIVLRTRTERWVRGVIEAIRGGTLAVAEGSAADTIARHRGIDGTLLSAKVAGVELLNILRPTVAVARYVTFAALALHEHPECRERLESGGAEYRQWFVQEVRRYYPFFTFVAGRALQAFEWQDHHFEEGTWMLLDLYGTNHDARVWDEPEVFRPERFSQWDGSAYNFIPQGGGDFYEGHRCPGEWITIELLKRAVELLTSGMQYRVPQQDLQIDLSRMPAIPKSRFVIDNVQRVGAAVGVGQT